MQEREGNKESPSSSDREDTQLTGASFMAPAWEAELTRLKADWERLPELVAKGFPTTRLPTRRLAGDQQEVWQGYAAGEEALLTDPASIEELATIRDQGLGSASVSDEQIVEFRLEEVLADLHIPNHVAHKIFVGAMKHSINLLIPQPPEGQDFLYALESPSTAAVNTLKSLIELGATHEKLPLKGLHNVDLEGIEDSVSLVGAQADLAAALTRSSSVVVPSGRDFDTDVEEMIRLLERLVQQAELYDEDLVAPWARYLEAARRLSDENRSITDQQRCRRSIDSFLAQFDEERVLGYLAKLPILLHRRNDVDGTDLATPIIVRAGGPILDKSFRTFWLHLFEYAAASDDPTALPRSTNLATENRSVDVHIGAEESSSEKRKVIRRKAKWRRRK